MPPQDWRKRFDDTVELLPVIVCEMDRNLRVTYVNETGYRITGYTDDDFRAGLYLRNLIPAEDRARAFENLGRLFEGTSVGIREYRILHRDGTVGDYQMNSAPIVENDAVVGVRTCLFDMSEHKRLTAELEAREEKFRRIFQSSPIAVGLFDGTGAVLEVNAAFRQLFAGDRDGHFELWDRIPDLRMSSKNLAEGITITGESLVSRGPELRPILLEWTLTPLEAPKGTLLVQLLDITARKEEEDRTTALLRALQQDATLQYRFHDLESRSAAMKRIFQMLPPLADASATVLINGESGTGKERIARAIHAQSPRRQGPFIAVNCSALPDTLLESELFGYKAGAFTDARRDKPGKFALARDGVLFLDEIGDISPAMQAKLLRVLQERTYEPLGGTVSVEADVRIIAATNRDLRDMVSKGLFREDLFYRLNVVRIELPPLRQRRCDIPALLDSFVEKFNRQFGRAVKGLSPEAVGILMTHDFPGNIRELENALEHAFVFCRTDRIEVENLPEELIGRTPLPHTGSETQGTIRSLDELEAHFLRSVIAQCGGKKIEAAMRLGIHKTTLFRKLKKYGID